METKFEILRRVEGLFVLAAQLEMWLAKARGQVDKSDARAFAGKLVPQKPNDEPAEKLLERIACVSRIKRGANLK
jgi:type I restriction enzyme S subunit